MEKKRISKIRKWDEVSGSVEEDLDFIENPSDVPGVGPSISRNYMRGVEDMVEQNDNSFDGVINNLPEEKPVAQMTSDDIIDAEQNKKSVLKKLQETSSEAGKPKPMDQCFICNAMEII